ncbi:ATP-binding protein [Methylomonas sp. AM2-LC]|uniref:ATP-binding protein n=1 Tax=Methylomonas sp. AM2-LC TaxID=3153301 RepID=UPI003262DF44
MAYRQLIRSDNYLILLLVLTLLYALLGKLSIDFFSVDHVVSLVWPCSGLALAALLLGGQKYWPGVFIGAFTANLLANLDLPMAASLACGNTLEAIVGARLLAGKQFKLVFLQDYFRLLGCGALAVSINTLWASATLYVIAVSSQQQMLTNMLYWWMGNELGIALVTPLILIWQQPPENGWIKQRRLESLLCFGVTVLIGQIIFLDAFKQSVGAFTKGYYVFAMLVWAALRFGRHGTLLIILITTVQALTGAALQIGYFAHDLMQTGLMNVWLYLMVLSIVGIALVLSIEQHERLDKSLYESDMRLNAAQQLAHIGCWTFDKFGKDLNWSDEIYHIFEIDPQLTKMSYELFLESVHPDDRDKVNLAFSQATQENMPLHKVYRLLMKDGRVKYVESRCVSNFDVQNKAKLSVGTIQDITARIELENSLHKFQLAVEQTPDSIMITDTTGRIEYVNQACLDVTGYQREDFLGETSKMLKSGKTPIKTYTSLWDTLTKGDAWKGEFINRRKNGEFYTEHAHIAPIKQDDGTISHYLAVRVDISEHKRNELELNQYRNHLEELVAQRTIELEAAKKAAETANEARSVFLANMSHEIRTPLNAILGLAETGMNANRGRRCEGTFHHILDSGRLLLCVVNDILDFSKIEANKLLIEYRNFELTDLLERVMIMTVPTAYEKGLDISVSTPPDLPTYLKGDELRISQILLNLLTNAVKFTQQGQVSLCIEMLCHEEGFCSELMFHVKDSGIGITEQQIAKLFMPFEQADGSTSRRFGGSGLGLVISQRLAQLMGGTILVKSQLGQGSLFTLHLPLDEPVALKPPPESNEYLCIAGFSDYETQPVQAALTASGVKESGNS